MCNEDVHEVDDFYGDACCSVIVFCSRYSWDAGYAKSWANSPPAVDPCQQLSLQLNMTIGQLASWRNMLDDRRDGLAARQAFLVVLQDWLSLFYETVANQGEPMTPGQQITEMSLLMAIGNQNMEITQWQILVNQAQMQVTQWQNAYNQALQAYQAAGC